MCKFFECEEYDNAVYRFCRLRKGDCETRVHLPVEFAVLGKVVKIRNQEWDKWDDGWEVVQVSTGRPKHAEVLDAIREQTSVLDAWDRRDAEHRAAQDALWGRYQRRKFRRRLLAD